MKRKIKKILGRGAILLGIFWVLGPPLSRAQGLPAPAGLLVVTPVDGQVNLQWNPVPAATAYSVSRALLGVTETPTSSPTPMPPGTLTPTPTPLPTVFSGGVISYRDSQVTNGRSYLYQVSALDGSGPGPAATVEADPFSVPEAVPVTVSNLHSQALDLFWDVPNSTYPVSFYQIFVMAVSDTPTPVLSATATRIPPSNSTPTYTPTPYLNPSVLTSATPLATVAGGTTYTDTSAGSTPNAVFYYVVRAVDNLGHLGDIPTGNSLAAIPKSLGPLSPNLTGLVAESAVPLINATGAVPGYGVRLIWNGALDVDGVSFYQISINNTPVATQWATPLATATYDDPSIPFSSGVGSSTSYKVTAFSSTLTPGADSNTVFETIFKSSVSGNLQVTPDATTQAVTLTWNQGSPGSYGLNGYRLYKGLTAPSALTGAGTPSPTPTITPTAFATIAVDPSVTVVLTPYVETGIASADGYQYWVEPYDGLGLGGNIAVPTPASLNLRPGAVGSVSASTPVGNNRVDVSWSPASANFYGPPVSYVLYREIPLTLTPTPVATVSTGQTIFTDYPTGPVGSSVLYQVAGVDNVGNKGDLTSYSNPVTLLGLSVPAVPQVSLATGTSSALQYAWLNNPPIDNVSEYDVLGPDGSTVVAVIQPTPGATFTTAGVTWIASFNYLKARNSFGLSGSATLSGIPVPSYQVTAWVTPGAGGAKAWVSSNLAPVAGSTPGIDSYGIYRSLTPGAGFTPIATVLIPTPGYLDSSLQPGNTYYYRVTARADGGGLSAESPLYPTTTPTPEASVLSQPNSPAGLTPLGHFNPTVLYWAANAAAENVLSYTLYQNGTPVAVVTPSPTMAAGYTETPGRVYSYQVAAENASGSSTLSGPISILPAPWSTPTVILTPPHGFTPTPNITPAIPRLVWISGLTYPGSVSGYTIYRSTDSGFLWSDPVAATTKPVSSVSDAGVTGYVNYYKAAARTVDGLESDPVGLGAVSIGLWPNAPSTPTIGAGSSMVTLLWSQPDGNASVTGYNIYRATGSGGPLSLIGQVSAEVTPFATPSAPATYMDGAVSIGRAYYYWVDSQGNSLTSDNSVPFGSIIPLNPPSLQVTPGPGRNTLVWSPLSLPTPSDVTGYVVYRMALPTPAVPFQTPVFSQVGIVLEGLGNTSYADMAVTDNVSYEYEVAAASQGGAVLSSFSASAGATVHLLPVMNLTAVSGDGVVQLQWEYQGTPNNIYNLQRKLGTDSDANYQTIKTNLAGVNYNDTTVGNKTFYNYQIVTTNPLTSEAPVTSNVATALPAKPPIIPTVGTSGPPVPVAITQNAGGNILNWSPANPDGIDPTQMYPLGGYRVYRSLDGGGTYQLNSDGIDQWIAEAGPGQTSLEDSVTIVGSSSFTYRVTAFDAPPDNPSMAHESSYSLVTVSSVGPGTELDRNALRPGNMMVHIQVVVPNTGKLEIKVFTLSGVFVKKLASGDFPKGFHDYHTNPGQGFEWDGTNMNGSTVASGVYFITTEMNGLQEIHKVAVIK